jgi:hypothetical protein
MIKRGLRPGIKFSTGLPGGNESFRQVLPFRRSWLAIGILAAFDIVFLIPAVTVFKQAWSEWSNLDDLFSLVGALFSSAWLLGWSIAPLIMTGVLVLLLFGREVVRIWSGAMTIFTGLPFLGVSFEYETSKMRNPRFEIPPKKSGTSWRGKHMVFDYGANAVAVGSDLDDDEFVDLKNRMQAAAGHEFRRGEAAEPELSGDWKPGPLADAAPQVETYDPVVSEEPLSLASPSTLALIIANLVPLAGAAFLGWDMGDVMVLYWAESAVIGIFNVAKIIVIGKYFSLLAAPFFLGHFGAFMSVHFLFIYGLFIKGPQDTSASSLAEVTQYFSGIWLALAALFISHGLSFFINFLGRKEYLGRTVNYQMSEPYKRIVFMHLVLIFGGGLTLVLGQAAPVLIVVIAAKIWFDIKAHLKQHQKGSDKNEND